MEIIQWKLFLFFGSFLIMYLIIIRDLSFKNSYKTPSYYRFFNRGFNTSFNTYENIDKSGSPIQSQSYLILTYTTFFGDPFPIQPSSECGFNTSNFQITNNKEQINSSNVVMFHSRNMPSIQELERINNLRRKDQLWIYFTMESIYNNPGVDNIDKYFNASATYGVDTDIPFPYRYHKKRLEVDESYNKDRFLNKTRMVAWTVSNCNGDARNKLALKLISYGVDIEVSGGCAGRFPKRFSSKCRGRPCYEDLRDFKFYFSAENSLCDGYITEKYWSSGIDFDVIPIVLGGSNYSDPRLAIPGSYIDAMSFDSPKTLADYILDVSSNSTKYNSFFEWKKHWQLDSSSFFCMLCDKLRNGISFRTNPLLKTMNREKCTRPQEKFNIWINRN
ncbi:3-galactosyl-N-acetylglucosaminide 4-alpha-L-fucosyltransferase FUT3 [Hydra vulgaris]|uniref:3-galactosyl-N-acetylglucosaminide 4-alpha-L-fucosyltransferase FUT3 n=1 Tax=Hydra vulgaris TaxID=6087 RepID=UPI000640F73C|nr:3-galactosyl-N-acetylglucosaminide 4-alpha-L-fucosyltransferase FUT3 isoform X1 [Hydra vulgaris]